MTKQQWIISFITGLATLYYAKKQNKNPYLWFTIGFMFGIVGLCFLLFFPRIKEYFNKKKTPIKTPETQKPPAPIFSLETIWYYLDENRQQNGPMSFQKLQETQKEGTIHLDTYIWNETLTHWKKWEEIFPTLEVEK